MPCSPDDARQLAAPSCRFPDQNTVGNQRANIVEDLTDTGAHADGEIRYVKKKVFSQFIAVPNCPSACACKLA